MISSLEFIPLFRPTAVLIVSLTFGFAAVAFADDTRLSQEVIRAQVDELEGKLEQFPDSREFRYELGTALNELAMATDDGSLVDRSLALFESLHAEQPDDASALAMLGSTQTLKARFAGLFSKMTWLRRGLRTLDAAYAMAGDDRDVRLIRAANAAHLPAWLDRDEIAEVDFSWLLADLEGIDACCSTHAGAVYYFIGYFHMARGRMPEAQQYFERARELPQTPIIEVKLQMAMDFADNSKSSRQG